MARALGSEAFDSATLPLAMNEHQRRGEGLAGAVKTPGMQAVDHIMGEPSSPSGGCFAHYRRKNNILVVVMPLILVKNARFVTGVK